MFRYERAKKVVRRTRPRPSSLRPENNDQEMPQKHDRDLFFLSRGVGTVYKNPLFAPAVLGGREIGRRKDPAMDFLPVRLHPPPRAAGANSGFLYTVPTPRLGKRDPGHVFVAFPGHCSPA